MVRLDNEAKFYSINLLHWFVCALQKVWPELGHSTLEPILEPHRDSKEYIMNLFSKKLVSDWYFASANMSSGIDWQQISDNNFC